MKIFIIGVAGGVGRRIAEQLVKSGDVPLGLVRKPEQADELVANGIQTTMGDLVAMSRNELAEKMLGSDAVIFSAGAGGKGGPEERTQVDGNGPGKAAAAAKQAGIRRFILVSVFPEAWRERHMNESFEHYMIEKKRAETELVQTDIDWLIVRPSALTNEPGTGRVDLGLAKTHTEIARDDLATTVTALLRTPDLNREIIELTGGDVAIEAAIDTFRNTRRR